MIFIFIYCEKLYFLKSPRTVNCDSNGIWAGQMQGWGNQQARATLASRMRSKAVRIGQQ